MPIHIIITICIIIYRGTVQFLFKPPGASGIVAIFRGGGLPKIPKNPYFGNSVLRALYQDQEICTRRFVPGPRRFVPGKKSGTNFCTRYEF